MSSLVSTLDSWLLGINSNTSLGFFCTNNLDLDFYLPGLFTISISLFHSPFLFTICFTWDYRRPMAGIYSKQWGTFSLWDICTYHDYIVRTPSEPIPFCDSLMVSCLMWTSWISQSVFTSLIVYRKEMFIFHPTARYILFNRSSH